MEMTGGRLALMLRMTVGMRRPAVQKAKTPPRMSVLEEALSLVTSGGDDLRHMMIGCGSLIRGR